MLACAFQADPAPQADQPAPATAAHAVQRAADLRQVRLIINRHGWHDEIERATAAAGVPSLKHLDFPHIQRLLCRLRVLEDCLYLPCDLPDAPPAR